MRADFFVHPGYHAEWNVGLTDKYFEYEEALRSEAADSPLAIHIYDKARGPMPPPFDWIRFFEDGYAFPTLAQMGELERDEDAIHIVNLLRDFGVRDLRIHGSYYEICVHDLISHLEEAIGEDNVVPGNGLEPAIWMYPDRITDITIVSLGQVLSGSKGGSRPWSKHLRDAEIESIERRLEGYAASSTCVHHA
jgi:hypothetical protein